jgi:hypothetical protein
MAQDTTTMNQDTITRIQVTIRRREGRNKVKQELSNNHSVEKRSPEGEKG